jgi:hypothetical protein
MMYCRLQLRLGGQNYRHVSQLALADQKLRLNSNTSDVSEGMVRMQYQRAQALEQEFNILIELMAEMITAQADQYDRNVTTPAWMFGQHDLAKKLFRHMCSARSLLEPSPFRSQTVPPGSFIDHSSMAVLTRSALENYLVMTWLLSGGNDSLREFRNNVWEYCGWKKRSKMAATTDQVRAARQKAVADATALWPSIQSSPHFENYSESQQDRLRKGSWDVGWHWHDLAVDAGLHKTYFMSYYPCLTTHFLVAMCTAISLGRFRADKLSL